MACRCSFLHSGPAERAARRARDKAGSEGAGRQAVITAGTTARQERPGGGGLPHEDTYGTARHGAARRTTVRHPLYVALLVAAVAYYYFARRPGQLLLLLCTQAGPATTTTISTTLHAGRASYYYYYYFTRRPVQARPNTQDAKIKVLS